MVAAKPQPVVQETEEDRERKRRSEAAAIVPDNSTCLPGELRKSTALHLELGAIEEKAVVCIIDEERTRLLGPIACWDVEVRDPARAGSLAPRDAKPLPGRGYSVMFDDRCTRGYCLPADAKVPADPVAQIAWNTSATKVAVLAGDTVHLFDAVSKAHEASFSVRGDKGVPANTDPVALYWNGDATNKTDSSHDELFVEATDGTTSPVYAFKADGTAVGPIDALGGREKTPLSTRNGSFMLLYPDRVAISEEGLTALTIYEMATGKRTKLVRKLPTTTCKKDELEAAWREPASSQPSRCRDYINKSLAQFSGADAVGGTKNFLMLLRGPRIGELAVIDSKTLAEHKVFKMPWCDGDAGGGPGSEKASAPAPASEAADVARPTPAPAPTKSAPKRSTRGPMPKPAAAPAPDDPDTGGQ